MSKNFHQSLSNKFNKKKTIAKELSKLSTIHKKSNAFINNILTQHNPVHIKQDAMMLNDIYSFDKFKTSTSLNIELSENNYTRPVSTIEYKEILIPTYSINDYFDLNQINQNISIPIHMTIIDESVVDELIHRLKKRNIKKIYHIYQQKYADDLQPTGFGDFIRSCFFIIQFCTKYGFDYEIIINHPIAQFLKKYQSLNITNRFLLKNVSIFKDSNWMQTIYDADYNITNFELSNDAYISFLNYLVALPVIDYSVLSYNIFFPIDNISPIEIDKISLMIEPSREMEEFVDNTLDCLQLTKHTYYVIHIRCGDLHLKGQTTIFPSLYIESIKSNIRAILKNATNTNVVLLADNNEIKRFLKHDFPSLKVYFKEIVHLGEDDALETDKVKNTLLDFYIMRYSSYIYTFTSYLHGSGFSHWCSKIYNIPYNCKYISK